MVTIGQIFRYQQDPSSQLLQQLTSGPTIHEADTEALCQFSRPCNSALRLQNHDSSALPTLDLKATQHLIFNRLSHDLKTKWLEKQHKFVDVYGNSPFHKFADWIDQTAVNAHRKRAIVQPRPETTNPPSRSYPTSSQTRSSDARNYSSSTNYARGYSSQINNTRGNIPRQNSFPPTRT